MVITALTRNQVGGNASWVRIPPPPPYQRDGFDTKPSCFFYVQKPLWHNPFDTLEQEDSFIMTKLSVQESELEDLNPPILPTKEITMKLSLLVSFIVNG